MIKTIPTIKGFGVFDDFRWPAGLPEFKKFNLIYGWNYSGKTTLSRAFRCFEQKQMHVDFVGAQMQLRAEDGSIHQLSAPHTAPEFRVFNSDFVRDNLRFDLGNASPILVLGAEDIAKQEALKEKKAERETLAMSKRSNEETGEEKQNEIDAALTSYARDYIKNPLSEVNYDKRRFEPKVIECKSDHKKYLLSNEALADSLAVYRSTDKKPALSLKVVSLTKFSELIKKTTSLVESIVTATNSIHRLTENPAVERWVQEGRPLHEHKDECQFCGQSLPKDLMNHLTEHFSADYDNLMAELNSLKKSIQDAQAEQITLDHKSDFYVRLSGQFATQKEQLIELLNSRKGALQTLLEIVNAKQNKAFTSLECPVLNDPDIQIASVVEAINKTIEEHNTQTTEFDKNRKEAFLRIEKHYAASFVRDQQYDDKLERIADLKAIAIDQGKKLGELEKEIHTLGQALSEASRGAERINELLSAYFGKEDLKIVISADKRFQIVRVSIVAKNLSEGEKTAIAFAYFITSVQDGRHPLSETRIVIDDPISSLDSNHLFNTYALIKTQLAGCRQLFVSTHSFEFYNLIREWVADDEKDMKKPQAEWKKWGVFYLKRTDAGKAVLEEIPKELLKFKSEYHYLFSTLYHFDKDGAGDFEYLLGLPNVVRRFMEAFGGIMIPLSTGLKGKMGRLFTDKVVQERVWKFINHYSHNTTITRSLTIPDMSECKAVVNACLDAVRDWNIDYFNDLEAEVI
jgi:wobble nucleotide-excising tRNase